MGKANIRRGGFLGAAVALSAGLWLYPLPMQNEFGYWLLFLSYFGAIGYIVGEIITHASSVNIAFLLGFIVFGATTALSLFSFHLLGINLIDRFDIASFFVAIIAAGGALVSGITAIYVRDYRDNGRNRLLPRFYLQEMLIVMTLTAFLIGSITSILNRIP